MGKPETYISVLIHIEPKIYYLSGERLSDTSSCVYQGGPGFKIPNPSQLITPSLPLQLPEDERPLYTSPPLSSPTSDGVKARPDVPPTLPAALSPAYYFLFVPID